MEETRQTSDTVNQPSYDFEFAKICQWLKDNNSYAITDIRGKTTIYKKQDKS